MIDQRITVVPAAHVCGHRQRSAAHGTHLGGDRLAGIELARRDDHVGAVCSKAKHQRAAQAPAAAGDQRHLTAQIERVIHVCLLDSVGALPPP